MKPRECRSEVTAVRALTPEIIEVDLQIIEPADFTFEAGQWISVPFGPKNVRAWSMVSSPTRNPAAATSRATSPSGPRWSFSISRMRSSAQFLNSGCPRMRMNPGLVSATTWTIHIRSGGSGGGGDGV